MVHVWSKQQPTVALSSAEAEFVALCLAVTECLFVVQFLSELGVSFKRPVIHTDSKSALDMVSKRTTGRVKHLDRRLYFVKERVQRGDVDLKWIPGKENRADLLTKYLDRVTLERHRRTMVEDKP